MLPYALIALAVFVSLAMVFVAANARIDQEEVELRSRLRSQAARSSMLRDETRRKDKAPL